MEHANDLAQEPKGSQVPGPEPLDSRAARSVLLSLRAHPKRATVPTEAQPRGLRLRVHSRELSPSAPTPLTAEADEVELGLRCRGPVCPVCAHGDSAVYSRVNACRSEEDGRGQRARARGYRGGAACRAESPRTAGRRCRKRGSHRENHFRATPCSPTLRPRDLAPLCRACASSSLDHGPCFVQGEG